MDEIFQNIRQVPPEGLVATSEQRLAAAQGAVRRGRPRLGRLLVQPAGGGAPSSDSGDGAASASAEASWKGAEAASSAGWKASNGFAGWAGRLIGRKREEDRAVRAAEAMAKTGGVPAPVQAKAPSAAGVLPSAAPAVPAPSASSDGIAAAIGGISDSAEATIAMVEAGKEGAARAVSSGMSAAAAHESAAATATAAGKASAIGASSSVGGGSLLALPARAAASSAAPAAGAASTAAGTGLGGAGAAMGAPFAVAGVLLAAILTVVMLAASVQDRPATGSGYAIIVATALQYWHNADSIYDLGGHPYDIHSPTDCSGLAMFCYQQAGVDIEHFSESIRADSRFEVVPYEQAVPGDIIYWPGHIAVYVGDIDGDGVGDDIEHFDFGHYPTKKTANRRAKGADATFLHMPGLEGAGNMITIPPEYGNSGYFTVTMYTSRGWMFADGHVEACAYDTAQTHAAWVNAGSVYTNGIATLNGRYLCACTSTFGRPGDLIDWFLDDGTVIPCVIADEKSQRDPDCNMWGHANGQTVLEFEVQPEYYRRFGNPGNASWYPEWGGHRVIGAANYGPAF